MNNFQEYDHTLPRRPIVGDVSPGDIFRQFAGELDKTGEKDMQKLLDEISAKIIPGMVHWNHPKNIAWFPNLSPRPVVFGAMLENALNSVGFSWASSPASAELEQVVMDWIADLYGFPECFKFSSNGPGGGCFHGTASQAVFTACLAARSKSLRNNTIGKPQTLNYV